MSEYSDFRLKVVEAAAAVMNCDYCRSAAGKGQPQPGWIGSSYRPGCGLVVVLQNPAAPPKNYSPERERQAQKLLSAFATKPSSRSHNELMQFIFRDMIGEKDTLAWRPWKHPIQKIVDHHDRIAWMNVVKFRTKGETSKDRALKRNEALHGAIHLQGELEILRPKGTVTVGSEARLALEKMTIPQETAIVEHLKLRSETNVNAAKVKQKLLKAGVDL